MESNIRSIKEYVEENKMQLNIDFDKTVDEWFETIQNHYHIIKEKMQLLRELDNYQGIVGLQDELLKVMQKTYRIDEVLRELVGMSAVYQTDQIVHLTSVMVNLNKYHEQALAYWENQYEEEKLRND